MSRIELNRTEIAEIHAKVVDYRVMGLSVKEMARRLNRTEYFIRKYLWYTSPAELKRIVDANGLRLVEYSKKNRKSRSNRNNEVLKLVREVEEEFGSITNAPTNHKNFLKIRKLIGTK